ncbi:hypothetical protein E4U55_000537 [Claviceps digitariae]|nr:hypothetical protein E4U55_000537 [Claviceps digitariae]
MSVDSVERNLVDRQQQSPLLQLPAELSRQIYAYIVPPQAHLYRVDATICAATCITPRQSNDYYCFDRRSHGDPSTAVWARRLSSSWGDHWRCEEVAKRLHLDTPNSQPQHDSAIALMASCRRIYEDVACLLADRCIIHVNDLATLDLLFDKRDSSLRSSSPGHPLTRAFFQARRLNLSLRLPPSSFKAIEANEPPPANAVPSSLSPSPSSPSTAWSRLWRNMTTLQYLQHIDLTLDHDSESSWSCVNEHAILAPLQILASLSHINTTVHMPKVASTRGNGTLHGLTTKRFTRQRFFTDCRKDGSIGLVYEEDAYKSLHRGPNAADMLRAAELTMHIWFQGVDMDYVAMDELSDADDDMAFDAL